MLKNILMYIFIYLYLHNLYIYKLKYENNIYIEYMQWRKAAGQKSKLGCCVRGACNEQSPDDAWGPRNMQKLIRPMAT